MNIEDKYVLKFIYGLINHQNIDMRNLMRLSRLMVLNALIKTNFYTAKGEYTYFHMSMIIDFWWKFK